MNFLHFFKKPAMTIGSLWDHEDRLKAAKLVKKGEVVGVFNRGVNALWLDASNTRAIKKLHQIKGEGRAGRPVALTIDFDQFIKMIDVEYLTPEVRDFLKLSENLREELGSLCFLRAPLKKSEVKKVPAAAVGNDEHQVAWLQTWDPHGHLLTESLIKEIKKQGVTFPAVTSMNISGEPEIVLENEAINFCKKSQLPIYLKDPFVHPKVLGSYSILTLSPKGIEVTRDGNIPVRVLQPILKQNLILEGAKLSKYPQMEFPDEMLKGLNPKGIRMAILLYLEGNESANINRHLKNIDRFRQ